MEFTMKWILSICGLLLFSISTMLATGVPPHPDPGGTEQTTNEVIEESYITEPSKLDVLQRSPRQNIDSFQTDTIKTTEQTFTETVVQTFETVGENIALTNSDLINLDKTLRGDVTSQSISEEQMPDKSITTLQKVGAFQSVTTTYVPGESSKKSTLNQKSTKSIINETSSQNIDTFTNVGELKNDLTTTIEGESWKETSQTGFATTPTERQRDGAITNNISKYTVRGRKSLSDLANTPNPVDLHYETQIVTEVMTRTELVTTYIIPTKSKSTVVDNAEVQQMKQSAQTITDSMDAFTDQPTYYSAEFQASIGDRSARTVLEVGTTGQSQTTPLKMDTLVTIPPTAVEVESEPSVTSRPREDVTILTSVQDILAQPTSDYPQLVQSSPVEPISMHGTSERGHTDGMSTSTDTVSSSLQTIPTKEEYVTGITTEVYTSKEYEFVPKDTSLVVERKERTTIQEPEFKTSAPVTKRETGSLSDSVTLITYLETERVPTSGDQPDTNAGLMVTDAYTIVTELQTVVETTVVPVEIVAPPVLTSTSTVTAHSTRVSWRASRIPVVRSFRVEYTGTFVDTKITVVNVRGQANYVIIYGLKSGERYKFRVSAIPVSGRPSGWSNTLEADTVMLPVLVSVDSIEEQSLTVSWRNNPNVAIRETRINYHGTAEDMLPRTITISNARTARLSGLYPGDLYEIKVIAFSPTNVQAVTNIQVGTRPFPPTLEPISYYNVSSIEIGVKPPTNSIVHSFNVSIQLQNKTEITYFHVLNLGSSVTNFVIPNLVSGGQYEIGIACIGYGFHEYSSWTIIRHTAKLYAPMIQTNRIVVTTDRINLFWIFRDYIDCSHFLITYYAIHGATTTSRTINRLRKSAQLQNLVPGETYTVTVKAISGPEFASSQAVNITTSLGGLRVEPITAYTSTSFSLSWVTSAQNAIIEYFVVSYTGANLDRQGTDVNVSGALRAYVLSGLSPGETYSINVQARSGRQSVDGNRISKTTIPSIPTNIDAPQTTTDTIHLSWDKHINSVVDTYEIKYHNTADNIVREGVSPNEGYVMKTLKPGAVYSISIRSVSGSEKSMEALTIQRTKLGQPSNIRVDAVTNTSFTILWTDPPGSYDDVAVSCDKCTTQQLHVFPRISMARFRKLSAGTEYRLTLVTEKRGFEDSAPATIIIITYPHSPEDLQLVSYSKSDISFAWMDRDCTSCFYRIKCVAYVDGWTYVDDMWHSSVSAHHEYSCSGLVPGELYTISVTSLINVYLNFKPPPLVLKQRTEPAMPSYIRIITRTSRSVTLAWERAEGMFDYYATELVSSRHTLVANYTQDVTTIDRPNLDPYLGYDFYIRTVSGKLISETRHIHFNTREGRPGQVALFKLIPVNPTKMSVHFEQPTKPNGRILGYKISYVGSTENEKRANLFPTNEHRDRVDVPYNATEIVFSSLRPGYMYSFSIMAETTVGYGPELVKNVSTPIWPPRATSIRPKGVRQEDITSESFPIEFDDSYFTDDYGEILYYSVIVAEAAAIVYDQQPESFDRPNVTMTTWSQAIGQDPIPRYQISKPIRYSAIRHEEHPEYTGSLRVQRSTKGKRITIGSESCSKRRHVYCNGPLAAGKTYVYNFRAFTEAGYTDTHFSSPVSLPEDDGIIIIAVLCALILLLVIVIILAAVFLRRNRKYGPDKPLLRRLSTHWSCKDDQDSPATPLVRCPNTKKYSRPIALTEFCNDYHQMVAHTHFGFSQEYESIQKVGKKLSWSAAVLPENVVKNRYSNILPYDRTRVKLTYIEGDEGSDYINASYIPGFTSPREFISCQGPLPGTIADMWRMIWELDISNIVMVTKLVERGKVRCDQYWPEDHKPVFFGDVIVTMTTKTETENCWHVREFMIQYGARTRKVKHFHFLDWPDHGVPDTSSPIIKFIKTVRFHIPDDNTPTLVHCSAGVGRTGTFICIDRLIQQIEEHDQVDIMGIVCEMRFHRSFMVQTEQQYIFIHKCLVDILEEMGQAENQESLSNGYVEYTKV